MSDNNARKLSFAFYCLFAGVFVFGLFTQPGPAAAGHDKFEYGLECGTTLKHIDTDKTLATLVCEKWEQALEATIEEVEVARCVCNNTCLETPAEHWYADDPVTKHKQETRQADGTDKNVTLPAILSWTQDPAWGITDGEYTWYYPKKDWCGETVKVEDDQYSGVHSYLLEIDNTAGQLNETDSEDKMFQQILTTNEFNPTKDIYPCFFNAGTTIKWRVRPCCDTAGEWCLPEDQAEWWTFTTAMAPELLEPQDPDWNGGNGTGDSGTAKVDFCSIKLKWCTSPVQKSKRSLNQGEALPLNYQLRVFSNENQILGTAAAPQCHYLEKQADGICKPDDINPLEPKTTRNWWSHQENPGSDRDLFTKNLTYSWQVRQCFDNPAAGDETCSRNFANNWGQTWKFTTGGAELGNPSLVYPPNDSAYANSENAKLIELPARIAWKAPCGINSFGYDLRKAGGASVLGGEQRTTASQIFFTSKEMAAVGNASIQKIDLALDTAYQWRVRSCWSSSMQSGNTCEANWTPWYSFRTTGRPPKLSSLEPKDGTADLPVSVPLKWESVPGAKSYNIFLNDQKISVKDGASGYSLGYPNIKQNTNYRWKVQTCADANGDVCGPATNELSFATGELGAPQKAQSPKDQETVYTETNTMITQFAWDSVEGARYYKFTLAYVEKSGKETNAACATGKKIETTVTSNSASAGRGVDGVYCLGKYEWSALACLDADCQDVGKTPSTWSFTFTPGTEAPKPGETSLSVCGLPNDNPNTQWDERESCQLKHMLILVEQVLNFFLFKLSFMLLPVLAVATGLIFYTQFGGPNLLGNVMTWWKWIGIGYALIFLSWLITGVMLRIFGYAGVWWQL